jgi:small subunit ribosomal protein S17
MYVNHIETKGACKSMKIISGKVVSAKMKNTLVVEVIRYHRHPLYKKYLKRSTRYKVHCEDSSIKEGDRVKIVSTRPISKEKHYKVSGKI